MAQPAPAQPSTVYLQHDRFEKPKESFKQIADLIDEAGLADQDSTIGDIGCGTGEFLHYLRQRFPAPSYRGWDILPAHVERGQNRLEGHVELSVGSALDANMAAPDSLDVALYLGVHSIFDDIDPCFENALSWTKRGGAIYFFGVFNPYPVDVWLQFRRLGRPPEEREVAFNTFAIDRVSAYLNTRLGPGR
ncbi:MAG: class I SAM-dependent methyltransferase, partial [Pseudomonadota bacterium]